MPVELRPLRQTDDRAGFSSGDHELDRFFHRYAAQNQLRHHTGTTYVAAEGDAILGFATIAPASLEGERLRAAFRRGLPRYPLPALRLARLAVDARARGRGVGSALLRHVLCLSLRLADEYGCVGVLVDAKSEAVSFYARLGFSPLELCEGALESRPRPAAMFLPLALIAAAAR